MIWIRSVSNPRKHAYSQFDIDWLSFQLHTILRQQVDQLDLVDLAFEGLITTNHQGVTDPSK